MTNSLGRLPDLLVELLDVLRQVSTKQLEMLDLVRDNVAQWAEVDSEQPDDTITPALKAFLVDLEEAAASGRVLSAAVSSFGASSADFIDACDDLTILSKDEDKEEDDTLHSVEHYERLLSDTMGDRTWTPEPHVRQAVLAHLELWHSLDHIALPESVLDLIGRLLLRAAEGEPI